MSAHERLLQVGQKCQADPSTQPLVYSHWRLSQAGRRVLTAALTFEQCPWRGVPRGFREHTVFMKNYDTQSEGHIVKGQAKDDMESGVSHSPRSTSLLRTRYF